MFPLLPQQQAIYLFERLKPGTSTYHRSFAIAIKGKIDAQCLQQAITELQSRHPVLRSKIVDQETPFFSDDSIPVNSPLSVSDLTKFESPSPELLADFLKNVHKEKLLHAPFDFLTGPLWRCELIQFANDQSQLVFVFHDIIVDDNSLDLIINQLSELYNALYEKRLPNLPSPPDMKAVFDIEDERYQEKINYWQENLADLTLLPLLSDYPQKKEFQSLGERSYFNLDPAVMTECQRIANETQTTIENIIFSAVFVLLYRYTNEPDICIGKLSNNRNNYPINLNDVVSCFENSLPIRMQMDENFNFYQVLAIVEKTISSAIQQEIPINEIVHYALSNDVKSGMNVSSPFKILCNFDNAKSTLNLNNTVTSVPFELSLAHTKFEDFGIKFQLQKDGNCHCYIEFNTELFTRNTIENLAKRFAITLNNLLSNPHRKIKDIPFLLEYEKQIFDDFYHSTERQTPENDFFHLNFSKIAQQNPHKIATVFHDLNNKMGYLNYRELEQSTNELAAYLQNLGIGPEKTVGVCMNRSLDLIIAIIAILKAGGVVVPLESAITEDDTLPRIAYKINDALLDTLLVDNQTQNLFSGLDKSIFRLNVQAREYESVVDELELKYEKPKLDPHNLAYIAYTSGTTGEPKGVMVEHASFINLAYAIKDRQLPIQGNVLSSAPTTFDCFFWELLEWLSTKGGQLHLINDQERLSTVVQERIISNNAINCATLLPALLINLDPDKVPSLVDVISMGAVPHEETLRKWHAKGRTIRNEYGPTETTICATENPYNPNVMFTSIGVPIRNTQIMILDDNFKHRPLNSPGLIFIGGAGLARGYVGRNELTTTAFPTVTYDKDRSGYKLIEAENKNANTNFSIQIEKPRKKRKFNDRPTITSSTHKRKRIYEEPDKFRLYNTGDVGCYVLGPDKKIRINFLGRRDRQVKINGVRIELDGIETIIRRHPDIADVHLLLNKNKDGLIAYIVPKPGHEISKQALDLYLSNTFVPAIARPHSIITLEKFPLTKNGKIDAKALPTLTETSILALPSTPLQEQLCRIWCEVLNCEQVDVQKSFRNLGGTSIALVFLEFKLQEQLKISSQFGITMLNRDLTIESLEALLKPYLDSSLPTPHHANLTTNNFNRAMLPFTLHGSSKRFKTQNTPAESVTQCKNKL